MHRTNEEQYNLQQQYRIAYRETMIMLY